MPPAEHVLEYLETWATCCPTYGEIRSDGPSGSLKTIAMFFSEAMRCSSLKPEVTLDAISRITAMPYATLNPAQLGSQLGPSTCSSAISSLNRDSKKLTALRRRSRQYDTINVYD